MNTYQSDFHLIISVLDRSIAYDVAKVRSLRYGNTSTLEHGILEKEEIRDRILAMIDEEIQRYQSKIKELQESREKLAA